MGITPFPWNQFETILISRVFVNFISPIDNISSLEYNVEPIVLMLVTRQSEEE